MIRLVIYIYRIFMRYGDSVVPILGVLGKLQLSLPWEIVTADISQCDNEGAWGFCRGSGWAIKNASRSLGRMRAVGSMVVSTLGRSSGVLYVMAVHRPRVLVL